MITNNRLLQITTHIVVFICGTFLIYNDFPLNKMDGKYLWQTPAILLMLIVSFYIFTFCILPFLLKLRSIKIFSILTVLLYIIITLSENWLSSLHSSAITYLDPTLAKSSSDLIRPEPYILFKMNFFGSFLVTLVGSIPFFLLSTIYYFLSASKKHKEHLLSFKYSEFAINTIILASIYSVVLLYTEKDNLNTILLILVLFTLFFYLTSFVFTPKLVDRNTKTKYIFAETAAFLIIIILINLYIFGGVGIQLSIAYLSFPILILFVFGFIYGYTRIERKNQKKRSLLQLSSKESELKLLKSQVNPHFLFNTLNTIYSTALEEDSPKTSESIFKLANLLRYMQNDMEKNYIPLENEVKYIEDYIAIQELRCQTPPVLDVVFQNISGYTISPGILIPFVENAFKYGIDPNKKSSLLISLICEANEIRFKCINSYKPDLKTYYKENGFGMGIKNTRERLQLAYPDKHDLKITKTENQFTVNLNLIA
ncbi:sensor histidine kinase [Leeuwenhoekiella marinoflava]|uniref:sensor histidine kinase n=1 Tax=Leeuwenhoekiella marinoflava TaxID=988 RepID=UPI003002F6DC